MFGFLSPVIEPGFFSNAPVQTALIVGGIVAVVSGIVGTFTVMRGQSFAGHSLADIGTAGGSAAFLLGISPLFGFVAMNLMAAGVMEWIGIRRPRGRDLATGIVLGAALGLAALFLYLDTTASSTTGATVNVLFGSIFTLPSSMVPVIAIFSVVAAGIVLADVPATAPQLGQLRSGNGAGRACPSRGHRLPRRACAGRVALRGDHRRDPFDGAAHRTRCHGAAHHQPDRPSSR